MADGITVNVASTHPTSVIEFSTYHLKYPMIVSVVDITSRLIKFNYILKRAIILYECELWTKSGSLKSLKCFKFS